MLTKLLSFVAVASIGNGATANRDNVIQLPNNTVDPNISWAKHCGDNPTETKFDALDCSKIKNQIVGGAGSSSGGCSTAGEDLADAQGAFTAACSNMGLPRGVRECAAAVDKCRGQKKSEKKNYCPGAANSERAEKQLEKAEERLDKLKEKIPELTEKLADGASESNNKIAELRQKGRDAMAETMKAIKQAGRDKEDKQSKLVEQLAQVSSQMLQIDEQVSQLELSKSDAQMKRDETKTQIDLNCHQTASATVSKLQSDALAKMQAGVYSRGGQAAMLKNVGMSDRESWQKVAEKYYNWCLRSKPTIDSKTSANNMYTQAIRQTDKAIENAKKRKALLQAQANRLKDPNGACGSTAPAADGSTGETETCKANRQAAEDMAQLRNEYAEKMKGLEEDILRTQQDGGRKLAAQQTALASAQRDLNDEKTRVGNLRSVLDNDPLSKDEADDFRKAFSKWESAARKVDSCCLDDKAIKPQVCDKNRDDLTAMGYEAYRPTAPGGSEPSIPAADSVVAQAGETQTPRSPGSTTTPMQRNQGGTTPPQPSRPTTTNGEAAQ